MSAWPQSICTSQTNNTTIVPEDQISSHSPRIYDEDVVMIDRCEEPSIPTASMIAEEDEFFYGPSSSSVHSKACRDECLSESSSAEDIPALDPDTERSSSTHRSDSQQSLYNDTCSETSEDLSKTFDDVLLNFSLQIHGVAFNVEIRKA